MMERKVSTLPSGGQTNHFPRVVLCHTGQPGAGAVHGAWTEG